MNKTEHERRWKAKKQGKFDCAVKQPLTDIFREKAVPKIEEEMKQQLREYVIKE